MAARNWTTAQRERQAGLIHRWSPWKHSTGARTAQGKARTSRNAFRFTIRKGWLFQCWLCRQANCLRANRPSASIAEMQVKAKLCGVEVDWYPASVGNGGNANEELYAHAREAIQLAKEC